MQSLHTDNLLLIHDAGNGMNERKKDIAMDECMLSYDQNAPQSVCLANWRNKERKQKTMSSIWLSYFNWPELGFFFLSLFFSAKHITVGPSIKKHAYIQVLNIVLIHPAHQKRITIYSKKTK